jgi:hypothetical protein
MIIRESRNGRSVQVKCFMPEELYRASLARAQETGSNLSQLIFKALRRLIRLKATKNATIPTP